MSATSKIQWTDKTWNPVRGCSIVSPGCHSCYAMKQAHRFSGAGKPYEGLTKLSSRSGPQWTGVVRTVEDALLEPLSWRKPARVFVNSMSDLFHEDVPDAFIDRVFAVMALSSGHTFQILTKRADRMRVYMDGLGRSFKRLADAAPVGWSLRWQEIPLVGWPLPNVWLGVSVENQERADERIPLLLQTPSSLRFVSCEPLLGPVDIGMSTATCACCRRWPSRWVQVHRDVRPDFPLNLMRGKETLVARAGTHRAESNPHGALAVGEMGLRPAEFTALPSLDWVIVGGESGSHARPCALEWIENLVHQCRSACVPVFVKQLGAHVVSEYRPGWRMPLQDRKGGNPDEWDPGFRIREFPVADGRAERARKESA